MEYFFEDVLEIKNGKNQKAVENPDGKYPIYGSGGIMGYADDYICEPDTVIIGRKGNINNPIYVDEAFWNVDTAFGLQAKKELLNSRYLFYFCKHYDFEKYNKTVTIPSLTKSDLLKIIIALPDLNKQVQIVEKLLRLESIINHRREELGKFDELIKARFVEMFGHQSHNEKGLPYLTIDDVAEIYLGITHTPEYV
nr:restriction endonuclease subunit S [Lachnospiraceae bacterium]